MSDSERIQRILDVVVAAHGGDYGKRVALEEIEDELLGVEIGINYLLDELSMREEENESQAAKLASQAESLVRALSTPIITLWPGVLALPLIGDFDGRRAEDTTAVLLDRVASERASHVILDLTGVASMSLDTANSLLRMIRTTLLLGVTCIVTGIQPRAAQQFVELDADAEKLHTLARVSDALAFVLRDKGLFS